MPEPPQDPASTGARLQPDIDAPDQTGKRRGGEVVPAVAFGIGMVCVIGFVAVYFGGANTQALGLFAFGCLAGIGVGMASFAKRFLTPAEPDVEPRGRLCSTEEEIGEFHDDLDRGEYLLERRGLLTKMLLGALAVTGVGALVPFLSLGPNPDQAFNVTPWKKGKRLVDEQGRPLTVGALNRDGVLTVFPEDAVGDEFSQTLIIGVQPERYVPAAGRERWSVPGTNSDDGGTGGDGGATDDSGGYEIAAFSKLCTHAGCPVGLYEAAEGLLLCPCHQSTFDINDAAQPIFGPAATPLPQLPITVDGDGHLVADGELSAPPGPGFWNQRAL